jgi:hypothetical protein
MHWLSQNAADDNRGVFRAGREPRRADEKGRPGGTGPAFEAWMGRSDQTWQERLLIRTVFALALTV